ncbi:hypothetical protein L0Y46_02040 [bacterium]|nr:hypothetical protein [bacterium]
MTQKLVIIIFIAVLVLGGAVLFFQKMEKSGSPAPLKTSPESSETIDQSPEAVKDTSESMPEKIVPDEIQYLLFQIFNYGPNPAGSGETQPFVKGDVVKVIDEILGKIDGLRGDGKTRQLGFAVGPMALDHSDEELRTIIRESFKIAEEKNVAVAFHIDDSMFWINRKDLWQDKNNVEWSDWDGTAHIQRYVGWAPAKLAPQMCYTSPSLRKEITRIGRDIIGVEIKKGLDALKAKNKEHLFAGVIVGWETHLFDPSYINLKDETANKFGIVRKEIGYCALSNLGFSKTNPPKDFHKELEKVVQEWAEFWTKQIHDAGIKKEKIYTHFAFIPDKYISDTDRAAVANAVGVPEKDLSFTRITGHSTSWGAFNKYSRAGFSLYPGNTSDGSGTEATFSVIYEELKKHDNPHWALSEGTNTTLGTGGTRLSWESYLGGFFNHGASLVTIFAWQEPIDSGGPYGKATKGEDALAAYKKFLKGEKLKESPFVVGGG